MEVSWLCNQITVVVEDHLKMRNAIPHGLEDDLEKEAYPSVSSQEDCVVVIEILKVVVVLLWREETFVTIFHPARQEMHGIRVGVHHERYF
jgi:hypothetical protein